MTALILGGFAILALAVQCLTSALAALRFLRPHCSPSILGCPPVSVIRPVHGVDPFDLETLGSSFALEYPDYEVIFCAQTPDDPAVPLVRTLIAAHPGTEARLLIGENAALRNPKLRNVWKGWRAARHDWVCMADANLHLPSDYLHRVCEAWGPKTGMVSSPPWGDRPDGLAGHLECAFLNANQARLQLAIDSLGHGFAQGKTMLFNRPLLDGFGGVSALDRLMAEDVNATRLMSRLGLRVSLTRTPFAQPVGRRVLCQVWNRQVRWAQVRREGFTLLFMAEPLNGALLPALACAGVPGLSPFWVLPYVALWYASELCLARLAGWPSGPRDVAMFPIRDLMMPAIWIAALMRRDFQWRGTTISRPVAAKSTAA